MRKELSAIIVEDMPQARQALEAELALHCPEVKLIGTANSIVQAAKLMRQVSPDIIFLDILLGDGTGFDLLEIFPDLGAQIIFVTASDEFAIRAFRYAAIDYLLKPVDSMQLKSAVQRALRQQSQSQHEPLELLREAIRKPDNLPDRLSLHTQERILVVTISDIIRCESDGNNTWFFLKGGEKILVTRTLKQFDQMLEKHHFFRVHQSHLVNLHYLQEYVKKDGGYLSLKNGDHIPVALRKKQEVMELFQKWG
jgi:two-component system, LytTR family, response regulator